jgi:transcriptional regulator with XRE-family HTH domain
MTNLKQFIDENGLKQRRIAQMIGTDETTVSNWARDIRTPSDEDKARVVAALIECTGKDVTIDSLWPPTPAEAKS